MVFVEEDKKKKLIKLYCPSMAKLVQMVAWEEQKLDLGYISRAFGLDPATVKINGHFIARGVDFVASSVTWKSLFSFFSARGLSIGSSDSDALTIDGKLSKLGSKSNLSFTINFVCACLLLCFVVYVFVNKPARKDK